MRRLSLMSGTFTRPGPRDPTFSTAGLENESGVDFAPKNNLFLSQGLVKERRQNESLVPQAYSERFNPENVRKVSGYKTTMRAGAKSCFAAKDPEACCRVKEGNQQEL